MDETMKKKPFLRRLHDDSDGSIATYVLIMFGMSFMLFLFGFTSMYAQWSNNADINDTSGGSTGLAEPTINQGGFIEQIMNPINILAAGIAAIGGLVLITWFMGKGSTVVWQYAIPAIILLALNIFVFPISAVADEVASLSLVGFPIAGFLLIFFNLFYILAVIDFIRGPT